MRGPLSKRGFAAASTGVLACTLGIILGSVAIAGFGILLLVLCLSSFLALYIAPKRGSVQRVLSTNHVAVGDEIVVRVRVTTGSMIPIRGTWREAVPEALGGEIVGELAVPARGEQALSYRLDAERRGIHIIGPMQVFVQDPYGFVRRSLEFGEPVTVTVTPRVVPLLEVIEFDNRSGAHMQSVVARAGEGVADVVPRPYSVGDSMRRIHWRATARRGEPMVRQEEQEGSSAALIIVDRSRSLWPGWVVKAGHLQVNPDFETAISLTASIALHLTGRGFAVEVIDEQGLHLGDLNSGDIKGEVLLENLAKLTLNRSEMSLTRALATRRNRPIVVITGSVDEAGARALGDAGQTPAVLFAGYPSPGSLSVAEHHGWKTAELSEPAASWQTALNTFRKHGAPHE